MSEAFVKGGTVYILSLGAGKAIWFGMKDSCRNDMTLWMICVM